MNKPESIFHKAINILSTISMAKLSTEMKTLLPINSKSKVDELVLLLKHRKTVIDIQMYHRICSYIGNTQLEDYFFNSIDGHSLKIMKDSIELHKISISSLIDIYKPLDSLAKINHLIIDAIKENGGVISAEDNKNVYLKIWGPSLKSYWAAKCQSELRDRNLPPIKEKTVPKRKKIKQSKALSLSNKVGKRQRNPGVIDPNSADYNNQVLKESLRSKYTDYEYGLSDW